MSKAPRSSAPIPKGFASSLAGSPPPAVLIVDDLPANLLASEELVRKAGFSAVLAHSGSEALQQMMENEFACILMDLRMPGIDGLETAALIRKRPRHKDLPLIFVTSGDPTLAELSQGYSLGAVDFVRRPLESGILESKIRAVAQLYVERNLARREKDEELHKGRERLAVLFEQLPVALWSTDANLRVTFCAGSLLGQGGIPHPERLIGKVLSELIPGPEAQEHPVVTAHREALLGNPQTCHEEQAGRYFEGCLRPLRDENGRVAGVLGAAVEVTQRRQAEEALREGLERFELLMSGVRDCAIIFLDPKGRVVQWNAGAEAINGYTAAEAVGMPYAQFFTPEDRATKPASLLAEAARAGSIRDYGWRVRKNGSRFWAEILLTALRRADGTLRGYAKITRDLSERHAAEEKVEELVRVRTLALASTVEELQAFTHTVAHDVRAPLRSVSCMSEILLEEYRGKVLDARAEEHLKGIISAAQRMDRMTRDLLDYSRLSKENFALAATDPNPVLRETLAEMAQDLADRKAEVSAGTFPCPVLANPLLLKQVLANLLQNAIKFVAPGVEPRVRVFGEVRETVMRIAVEDNGIGISESDRGRTFKIFERLGDPQAYPGTGVGLAIVKRAVERMSGVVGLDSQIGRGSRFWFDLPKA